MRGVANDASFQELVKKANFDNDHYNFLLNSANNSDLPDDPIKWLNDIQEKATNKIKQLPPAVGNEFDLLIKNEIKNAKVWIKNKKDNDLKVSIIVLYDNFKRLEVNVDKYSRIKSSQLAAQKGGVGGKKRWADDGGSKRIVDELIKKLATHQQYEGWPNYDLWIELISLMSIQENDDRDSLNPEVNDTDPNKKKHTIHYIVYKRGQNQRQRLTFQTFCNNVRDHKKAKKLSR